VQNATINKMTHNF